MSSANNPGFGQPTRPPIRPAIRPAEIEIDLHGMIVSTAISIAERHISDAHSARLHIVKIIHGHGTGALKKAVHKHLKSSPLVKKYYLASHGDGGHGVTIAELDYGQRGSYDARSNNSITPKSERRK